MNKISPEKKADARTNTHTPHVRILIFRLRRFLFETAALLIFILRARADADGCVSVVRLIRSRGFCFRVD